MAEHAIEADWSAAKLKMRIATYKAKGNKEEKPAKPTFIKSEIKGVYFEDARDMSQLEDQSVHFINGSPSFGEFGYEYEHGLSFDVQFQETADVLKECARVLVDGGIMAINYIDIQDFETKVGNKTIREFKFTGHLLQKVLRKHRVFCTDVIQWKKPIAWRNKLYMFFKGDDDHTSNRIINQVEQVFIFRKSGNREIPDPERAITSRLTQEVWKRWAPSVWNIRPVYGQNKHGHPCVFPEALCNRLIKMYSYEGDTVLDPWLGSGTTVKVARDLNRIGIGYERELKYKPVIMKKLGVQPIEEPAAQVMDLVKEQLCGTFIHTKGHHELGEDTTQRGGLLFTNEFDAELQHLTESTVPPSTNQSTSISA